MYVYMYVLFDVVNILPTDPEYILGCKDVFDNSGWGR